MVQEKIFAIRLEDFPGRVGNNGVEPAAVVEDFVELESPVKGMLILDVVCLQGALPGPSDSIPRLVPSRLFIFDTETIELVEQDVIQSFVSLALLGIDRVSQYREVFRVFRCMAEIVD